MKNTIAERVADFLKSFPPFDQLSGKDVLLISQEVTISYFEKSKAVYMAGDSLYDRFYSINKTHIVQLVTHLSQPSFI